MTKFVCGRLGGITLTTFWPWGNRPHGVGAYGTHPSNVIDPYATVFGLRKGASHLWQGVKPPTPTNG